MFEDISRWVILTVVWLVVLVRTPAMVRDPQQRPLWVVLVVVALGAIPIQSWFAVWIDDLTGDPKFHNLFRGLFAVLDAAVTWRFVVHIAGRKGTWWHSAGGRWFRAGTAWAVAAAITICYYVAAPAERFRPSPEGPFAVYNLLIFLYLGISLGAAAWQMWRHLPGVRGRTLRAGLALVAIGNLMEVPFAVIRVGERLTWFGSPVLSDVAFYASTARFIMVPLGCVVAAFEPMRTAVLYYFRRIRLYSLWRSLRAATPEISLAEPMSRWQDIRTMDNAWERLHRRIIEIRDSAFHLYDSWGWPELLDQAAHDAKNERIGVTARWLEVATRESIAGSPKRYRSLDKAFLPALAAEESTVHEETRYLLELHRALRSPAVQAFASSVRQDSAAGH
ncbi:hypothetical protein LWC34_13400 [Kibdelosporangium philippinense]|uniref:DUF6545 domain-containing protein n=1 Tax=Kibdelosporangium philippinense TaxID=211113 RepID=A0ABS8Z7F2_9PSEU|nr:MAB_1171c family putative transporter [Kibdelosporangium philippinense]MCE7003816.1 hypothetical protein [Kibdelosporangium philippinense]